MLKYEAYHFGENNLFAHYHPNSLNYPRHLHRSFEFIYIVDGNIEMSINNRTFDVKKHGCILVLPYEVHSITTKEYSEANICVQIAELTLPIPQTTATTSFPYKLPL